MLNINKTYHFLKVNCFAILKPKTLVFLAFFGFIAGSSYAEPKISGLSGEFSHGQSVTINGIGFGSKSPASPQLWVPFDVNVNPSPLGVVSSWFRLDPGDAFVWGAGGWSGGGARANRTLPASGMMAAKFLNWNFNDPGQKSYIHRRAKRLYNISSVGGNGGLKALKLDYNETYGDNVVMNRTSNQWISQNYGASSYYYFSANNNKQDWQTEEFIIKSNESSNSWADLDTYIDYVRVADAPAQGEITLWENGTEKFNVITFWRYASSSPLTLENSQEYWDDLYVDNTWSRVIIGNASTYASCTIREIQIPTAWSSDGSSIQVSVNTGRFSAGQAVYLYVIDSNGAINNNGYSLKIGNITVAPPVSPPVSPSPVSPSPVSPPAAPTGLKIITQ